MFAFAEDVGAAAPSTLPTTHHNITRDGHFTARGSWLQDAVVSQKGHRSHFGSRYKLGCCGHAGLFGPGFDSGHAHNVCYDPRCIIPHRAQHHSRQPLHCPGGGCSHTALPDQGASLMTNCGTRCIQGAYSLIRVHPDVVELTIESKS